MDNFLPLKASDHKKFFSNYVSQFSQTIQKKTIQNMFDIRNEILAKMDKPQKIISFYKGKQNSVNVQREREREREREN